MLRRSFLSTAFAALLGFSSAFAQVGGGASTAGGAPVGTAQGGVPAISACGGGTPAPIGQANGSYGRIQTGTGATTSCTLTWTNSAGVTTPRAAVPACTATAEQAATTLVTLVPSVNGLVFTYTSTTAGVIDYHCDGV